MITIQSPKQYVFDYELLNITFIILSWIEVPKDSRKSKLRSKTSSRENGRIRMNAGPEMELEKVSGESCVLCRHIARLANVPWESKWIWSTVKFGYQVQIGNKVASKGNVVSMEGITVCCHVPEYHVSFGRKRFHILKGSPYPSNNFIKRDFTGFLTYPCPRRIFENRKEWNIVCAFLSTDSPYKYLFHNK